jgi:hypothetical protein
MKLIYLGFITLVISVSTDCAAFVIEIVVFFEESVTFEQNEFIILRWYDLVLVGNQRFDEELTVDTGDTRGVAESILRSLCRTSEVTRRSS